MTLSYTSKGNPRLSACPICGEPFPLGKVGQKRDAHFLTEHGPEDFGLSPLPGGDALAD